MGSVEPSLSSVRFLIVMGVSASGKTSVGRALAERLGWDFYEADDYHSPENVAKMSAGIPLDDDDRAPWLITLHDLIASSLAQNSRGVLACSALKQRYRQVLLEGNPGVEIVHLKGDFALFHSRMIARTGHYMRPELLASQFEDLEESGWGLTVDAALPVDKIVDQVVRHLESHGGIED